MNAVASFWIFVIMFLMTGDVLGRVILNHPLTGTPEIVKVSIVGIVFMQIPHTLWVDRHIRSEIIILRLAPLARELCEIGICILGAAVFLGIFVASWADTMMAWKILEYEGEGALRVPVYPIRTIILLGSSFTAIHFLLKIIQSLVCLKKMRESPEWIP
jgi:TRAP-type C4-dicarboxylate transport system permease small subunit